MNITKELLDGLNLVSLFFTQGKKDISCVLKRSERGVLFFNFTGDFTFADGERLSLSATFQKEAGLTVSRAGFKVLESGLTGFWERSKTARATCARSWSGFLFWKANTKNTADGKRGASKSERKIFWLSGFLRRNKNFFQRRRK